MTESEEKNQRLQTLLAEKTKKDVVQIRKQLKHERNMKLDAFHRVDDLQTAMYDIGMTFRFFTMTILLLLYAS